MCFTNPAKRQLASDTSKKSRMEKPLTNFEDSVRCVPCIPVGLLYAGNRIWESVKESVRMKNDEKVKGVATHKIFAKQKLTRKKTTPPHTQDARTNH